MKDILLSFIIPSKIKRYRFMSIFVSMLIFVVGVYCIALPNQSYTKRHKDEFLDQKIHVSAYTHLDDLALGDEFINSNYKIEEHVLVSNNTTSTFDKYLFTSDTIINGENKTINVYVIFDKNNSLNNALVDIQNDYASSYQEESETRIKAISYLYYIEKTNLEEGQYNEDWRLTKYQYYKNLTDEQLNEQYSKLDNFDLFGIDEQGDNNYLLMFFKDQVVSQVPYYPEGAMYHSYTSFTAYYEMHSLEFDFTEANTLNEFGKEFADCMFKPLYDRDQTNYLLVVVGYVLLYPAIYSLLMFWCMKKRGVMKSFKEYYNVAGIASVLPTVIVFIVAWFVPEIAPLYGALFSVFTLLVFMKINTTPELAD